MNGHSISLIRGDLLKVAKHKLFGPNGQAWAENDNSRAKANSGLPEIAPKSCGKQHFEAKISDKLLKPVECVVIIISSREPR